MSSGARAQITACDEGLWLLSAGSARVTGAWPHVQIGSYDRVSGLADLRTGDGDGFRAGAEFQRRSSQKVRRVAPLGSLVATA